VRRIPLILAAALLSGCTLFGSRTPRPEPTLPDPSSTTFSPPAPEAAATRFLDAWGEGRYEEMYTLLSPLTQDAITLEDFTAVYEGVRTTAAVSGVDYEIVSSLINPRAAQVAYRVVLHSAVVGDVFSDTTMDLTLVDGQWRVAWTEGTILRELAGGDQLYLDHATLTRANIYDRNGLALAAETDAVALWIVPGFIGDGDAEDAMLSTLGRLVDRRPEAIAESYEGALPDWQIPVGEVSLEDFQRVEGTLTSVGGVDWRVYSTRFYAGGGYAPHAVGYVAQITEEDLTDYLARGYEGDEFVGRTGLELIYEDVLRGRPGGSLYVMNAAQEIVGAPLASREPEPPQAVYTTLDRDLQRNAQQAIAGLTGAVVVLERDTGAVLAIASSPSFDANLYDTQVPYWQQGLAEINGNPAQPWVDRATDGLYPLGSVFKIITMSAALESGFYTPESTYTCNGEFTELPGITLYDWTVEHEDPPHGTVTLLQGLERSCNPYFWHIGLDLYNRGLTTALPDMADAFGLGQSTGIEIGDSAGIVPDPEWKQENVGEAWAPGDSVQLAIGQASLNITPLQVARFIAAVGNGGTLYRPQLVMRIEPAVGEPSQVFEPEVQGTLPLSPETLTAVQTAMTQVVRATNGTAYRRFLGLGINIAGKTGTATTVPGAEPHAWFAGYTFEGREDLPDVAIVVVVENQGEGSDWAAPIFRRVVESYFFGAPRSLYPWESQIGLPRTPTPTPEPGAEPETPTPEP
jgi:penicillin-binding protein 2